jgi:hypothetical protein
MIYDIPHISDANTTMEFSRIDISYLLPPHGCWPLQLIVQTLHNHSQKMSSVVLHGTLWKTYSNHNQLPGTSEAVGKSSNRIE